MSRVVWLVIVALGAAVACESSAPEGEASPDATTDALAPAHTLEPPATPPLFECRRDLDRGYERIVEVSRTASTSVIQVDTDYWGGATDGVIYGMDCLARACQERGYAYYVILSSRPVRYGTSDAPGNTWEATIGFLSSAEDDVATNFPEAEAGRSYRVWPARSVQGVPLPVLLEGVMSTDAWELFSTVHFRHRAPGEKPGEWLNDAELARRADEAERRLAAARGERERLWKVGDAAKTAAMAGRWGSAAEWAREVLAAETTDDESGNGPHEAHIALGLVAVHEGDLDAAQIHLLKSGMTTGSPTMNSFGPNMSLAKALIEAGQSEVVLQYFDQCEAFWEMGGEELAKWRAIVEQGGVPDFGANLIY